MCMRVSFTVTPPLTVRRSTSSRTPSLLPNQYSASGRGPVLMWVIASSSRSYEITGRMGPKISSCMSCMPEVAPNTSTGAICRLVPPSWTAAVGSGTASGAGSMLCTSAPWVWACCSMVRRRARWRGLMMEA